MKFNIHKDIEKSSTVMFHVEDKASICSIYVGWNYREGVLPTLSTIGSD